MGTSAMGGSGDYETAVTDLVSSLRGEGRGGGGGAARAISVPGFCKDWPIGKMILGQIKGHLPPIARVVVQMIIDAGDALCGGSGGSATR